MFGKARCRLCGDRVRFVLRHLRQKHPEAMDIDTAKMTMEKIVKKYFLEDE
jgi:hypothetical protein